MDYDFRHIAGPRSSKASNFEELMAQLLSLELNAIPLDGAGGDEGIDAFVVSDAGTLVVFQCKYFLDRLTRGRRRQIETSFQRAVATHRVGRWVLCIPINATPEEQRWFQSLGHPDVVLDWWGESRIRALLAKHPHVADAFFPEDVVSRALRELTTELQQTLRAWESTPWSQRVPSDEVAAMTYLKRAATLGDTLSSDLPLFDTPGHALVAIDFSDLYCYFASDTRLLATLPVVEYCISEAPWPLYLLPGTVVEISSFIQSVTRRTSRFIESAQGAKVFERFVSLYEEEPTSMSTADSWKALTRSLQYEPPAFQFAVGKLTRLLQSGKLTPTPPSDALEELTRETSRILDLFNAYRSTSRRLANAVDAQNLALIVLAHRSRARPVRMISSAPSFRKVADTLFADGSLVRNCAELAYLLNLRSLVLSDAGISLATRVAEVKTASVVLGGALRDYRPWPGTTEVRGPLSPDAIALLSALDRFAPVYRTALRPVDEMIVTAVSSLPKTRVLMMREFYEFVTGERNLVEGFRRWWEQIGEVMTYLEKGLDSESAKKHVEHLERELGRLTTGSSGPADAGRSA